MNKITKLPAKDLASFFLLQVLEKVEETFEKVAEELAQETICLCRFVARTKQNKTADNNTTMSLLSAV